MALKTPAEYRTSLQDGRINYLDGDLVEDITKDPRFAIAIECASQDYDYENPALRDVRLYRTEDGELAHRIFQIARTEEDLYTRVELLKHTSVVGSTTQVFMALLNAKDKLAAVNPQYAENIERMYRYARDNDLRGAEVITDAKGDRSRRPADQDDPDLYTHIVDRNKDGIVVRGGKLHITGAGLVHELVVMPTKSMGPGEEEFSVSFSVPPDTPGVTIINRAYAQPEWSDFDYPHSARDNMPEALVVFDDVFVPWDRVFLAGEWQLAGTFAHALGLWERIAGLAHSVEKAKVYVGLAQLLAEYHGIDKAGHVQEKITELMFTAELLRMALDSSLRRYQVTESGMIFPNPLDINVGKYHAAANNNMMIRHIHDIAGAIVVTMPTERDLRSESIGKYVRKYLHTKNDVDVEDRMKLINYIRDTTADAYGGWNLVASIQAGGGLAAQRMVTYREYDIEAAKQAAREAAGLSGAGARASN